MMDRSYILKAQSPAALAEEYIVRSIWDKNSLQEQIYRRSESSQTVSE
ncbi:fatty acid metabolism regulator [Actinobacillus equuli]|nr:fatty acid metabolism regulator [Actinobacillus equuli]